ncbi:MAG TPA: DUF2085 domain-containing protein [Anaerolineae bacterium]|nr:DUF2085 domain-containing protein [Anaerolineae bacterium]
MTLDTPPLPASPWQRLPNALSSAVLLAIVGLFFIAAPPDLLDKLNLIGFALCHRLPERSFVIDGHQLPLCARCTGIYLGLLIGTLSLIVRRRTRASRLPATPIIVALIGFIVIMGIDGLNSTISVIPNAPQLWHTTNFLRITTGTLYGLAISMLFPPFFNLAVWSQPTGNRTLKSWRELLPMLIVAAVAITIVQAKPDWLLYPIALISIGGALALLSLINSIFVLSAMKLENAIGRWQQLARPLLFGLALGLIEITLLDLLRAASL